MMILNSLPPGRLAAQSLRRMNKPFPPAPSSTESTPMRGRRGLRLACLAAVTVLAMAFGLHPLALQAQVPGMIHYHGRILVGNQNFNHTGDFRFALVNEDGTTTFWSNDGTSANGSEPTDAVEIDVDHGFYSILLGDASLTNMDPIPPAVFENDNVWLRIWFDDGPHGSQLFVPDQRIVSVGYAMMSANVPDGAITTDKLAPGAVTGDKIAPDSIGSDQIADNALTSADIANILTLEKLNLGGVNWDGSLQLFAKPSGGGGGILNPAGEQRGHLIGDSSGSEFALRFSNSKTGAVLSSQSTGGRLRLWDSPGTMTTFLGSTTGGGDLRLFQISGNKGVELNGDRSTYDNQTSSGGEISVFNRNGMVGVLVDGDHSSAGRIEVRQGDLTPYVDIFGNGGNGGGEIRVKDDGGITTILLDGNGPDAGLAGNGYLQLGRTAGRNLVMDGNEITARDGGQEASLFLNPNQGNVVIGRTSELTPSVRLAVQSDGGQDALRVRVAGSTKLYVSGGGGVGINTTNLASGYELSVNGQVICEELVVQNSAQWPDYVFKDDYNLMSLDELEASIESNKHLPGIPPASEVEEGGISVGGMQTRMMEKIEELTLYVLQQNNRLKAQEEQLTALRSQMTATR